MTPEELHARVNADETDTVIVGFTDHFGRLMGKRYDAHFFLEDALDHGAHGCNYLLAVDMEMEPVPGYAYASCAGGYGDFHLVPQLSTLRRAVTAKAAPELEFFMFEESYRDAHI